MSKEKYNPQYYIMIISEDAPFGKDVTDFDYKEDKELVQSKVDALNKAFTEIGAKFKAVLRIV